MRNIIYRRRYLQFNFVSKYVGAYFLACFLSSDDCGDFKLFLKLKAQSSLFALLCQPNSTPRSTFMHSCIFFRKKTLFFVKKTSYFLFLYRFPNHFLVKIIKVHAGIDRQRLSVDAA